MTPPRALPDLADGDDPVAVLTWLCDTHGLTDVEAAYELYGPAPRPPGPAAVDLDHLEVT